MARITRIARDPGPRFGRAMVLLLLVGTLTADSGSAQTILNVERLQPGDVAGWHSGIEGEFAFARGNSEYLDFLSGIVFGHRWERNWLRAFVGLDYRSETDEALQNDRYLHVRYNRWWAERIQSFHFLQYQASADGFQRERALAGSGLRTRLIDGRTTLDAGTGAMLEREVLDADRVTDDHPVKTRTWRMANLLVATRELTETVRLIGVAYIQPELSEFDDTRLLVDSSVQIALTEQVSFTIRGEWRRDSRPPGGRDASDLVLRSGVTVSFR